MRVKNFLLAETDMERCKCLAPSSAYQARRSNVQRSALQTPPAPFQLELQPNRSPFLRGCPAAASTPASDPADQNGKPPHGEKAHQRQREHALKLAGSEKIGSGER